MRYANPHQQQGHPVMNPMQNNTIQQQQAQMNQLQQNYMQQQMMNNPMQQNAMQQQMMINSLLQQNPQAAMMVQQNPQLLNNPQFIQQLMAQAQMQRPNVMQQMPQMPQMMQPQGVPDNRYGTGIQQGTFQPQQQASPQLQTEAYTGRYGQEQQNQQAPQPQPQQVPLVTPTPQVQEVVPAGIPEFTVDGSTPIKFYGNTKVTITPQTTPFNTNMIEEHEQLAVDSLCTAIELTIEKAKESPKDTAFSVMDATIHDSTFKIMNNENYYKLFSGDTRQLYKTLKLIYNEAKSIDEITIAERINQYLTGLVNHYLSITLNNAVDINSFVEDFNDLLKVLRNNFEDAEDDLRDYIQDEIEEIHQILEARGEDLKKDFYLAEGVTVVYYSNHHYRLGLKDVDTPVRLSSSPTNAFLTGMAKHVFTDTNRSKFYLMTYDRMVFVVSQNKAGEVFVEHVEVA